MRGSWLCPALLVALFAGSVHAKDQKVHGYVTAVHSPASFDIDDYRILRDQSVTIEFVTDDDDQNAADYPKDIRVGSEIEIRGEYDAQTHELKAKSVKVYTRESRKLKRTAILDQVPQLHKSGTHWSGSFRADGQTIVVDETTMVSIVPNASQKSAMRQEAKQAKHASLPGDPAQTGEQMLARLDDVHVNMWASYEGVRMDDGRIAAKKVQFSDNEMTAAKAHLWKSFAPRVTPFKGAGPGQLNLGATGKYKLTPNEEVQNYVRKLGQRLLPASQRGMGPGDPNKIPFQFFVAESKGVNASAAPNGVVLVHREMLAMVETEGQLAAVIGHEIAHATQEHMLRQMEFHKKKRMLLQIGAAVAEAYGKYNVRDLLTLASAAIKNGYQRYLENQADRVGMEYMLAAGFDPREAPRVWKTMSSNMGDAPINFFWSDHDNNTTRRSYLMSELAVNYKGVEFDSLEKDSPEFHRIRSIVGGQYANAKAQPQKATVRLKGDPEPSQKGATAGTPAPLTDRPQPVSKTTLPADLPPTGQLAKLDPNLNTRPPQQAVPSPAPPPSAIPIPQLTPPAPPALTVSLDGAYDALRARDYPTAIAGFRQAIDAAPSNLTVRKDLAYTYLRIGENSLALDQLREAMRLAPNDTSVALEYAFLCYEATGPGPCPAQSRRIFDRIRKSDKPSDAATAEQAFQNIDAPLAAGIDRWKKAIELGANDFSAHYELATLAERRDDLPLAAENYEKAWRVLPDRRSVLVDLGRVWKALDRTEDATAALLAASHGGEARAADSARELLPDRYPYVAEFRRALSLDPHNSALRRELAYLLLSMGRQPAAEQEFRALTEADPADLLSATQLGFLLHARGDQSAAQPLFDRVLAGKDEDLANRVRAVLHQPQVLQPRAAPQQVAVSAKVMAERSIKAGYMKDAVKYLQTAVEADPNDFEVMLRLAWTYNLLHQDVPALHWFDLARKSTDPRIAAEAQKAWQNLRGPTERFRTTGWIFPNFSTRWHDLFGYGQVKTEVRTGLGFRPYLSVRIVGDTRQTEKADGPPQYLSESSVILGVGVATTPWHGLTGWAEAGQAFNYLSHQRLHDYRGGISMAYGTGHTLRGESPGWFANSATDAVFLSRFGNDVLVYNQERFGYTAGPPSFRTQIGALVGLTIDDQRQYWANYGEAGVGLRVSGSFLPASMYFTFDAVRGVYLVNAGNPRAPNFFDFRAGVWYAFTR